MHLQELKTLLERFYNGESDLIDQDRLAELLSDSDLPSDYYADRDIFLFNEESRIIPEPTIDFESGIMERIDLYEKDKGISRLKRIVYIATTAAATILILLTTYFTATNSNRIVDTFDDPILAYNETRRVLFEVSANLNKGSEAMQNLSYIEKARESLGVIGESKELAGEELSQLKYLNRGIDITTLVTGVKQPE